MAFTSHRKLTRTLLLSILVVSASAVSSCSKPENGPNEQPSEPASQATTAKRSPAPADEPQPDAKSSAAGPSVPADCAVTGSADERLARARELAQHKYSPAKMTCSVLIYYEAASSAPEDIDLHIEAMTTMNQVLYFLRALTAEDLMGVNTLNVERIDSVEKMLLGLTEAAYQSAPSKAGVMINKALAAKITDGAFDASLLQTAIETDPHALNGLAQLKLGRMLFELPSILGGNVPQSIAFLEEAAQINTDDMQILYYLAESYEQELEEDKAADVMEQMLSVEAAFPDQQMAADMLRLAAGLSKRMGRTTLSEQLGAKRNELLGANPELLTRVSIAVGGHGGEHPLKTDQ